MTKKVPKPLKGQSNDGLEELARERNMISDLIMDDSDRWVRCVFDAHDAHSFWSAVRKAHKEMSSNKD